ncbi:ABC transporter permease [Citroniella saccharovorans]|uniref:ABC transporter permease n=1 Tax=Citroniella saccharovorans TaxID=2053367 RepID=A0AAW9MXC5_9FIRM|nr:ABC transporter permease [Citroniella saccharovorans]MEB3429332.1 ABC transporter permease [Citroniella saccharovorans]
MPLLTILKKELSRVFSDRKMVFGIFIMPPLMMVIIFTLLGKTIGGVEEKALSKTSKVYTINMDKETEKDLLDSNINVEFEEITENKLEDSKKSLRDGDIDAIIELPLRFRENIENYDRDNIPNIKLLYNPSEDSSQIAYNKLEKVFEENIKQKIISQRLEDENILKVFTINRDDNGQIYKEEKMSGKFLATMLPYFIIMMLFSSIMGLAIDTFTGEKERGTMASLLLAPINRLEIVLGKLLGLTIISMLSSAIYTLALGIVIPKTVNNGNGPEISLSIAQFLQIGVIMLSMAFLLVALITVIATYAKNTKEAAAYISPLYIVVIVAGVLTMTGGSDISLFKYLIPIYGSSVAISNSIVGELTSIEFILSFGSNILFGLIFSIIVSKMFNSERIMFNS